MSTFRPSGRTLVDLLEGAAARYGERTALRLRRDDGTQQTWSYRELDRRSRLAAWRLRSRGLQPGDRLLTWSPSCPELAAAYFGAMRAGLILVPLDLRMAPDAIRRIVATSEARQLVIGSGRDAPDPAEADLDHLPTTTTEDLCAEPGAGFPADWEAAVGAWARPAREDAYLLVYTSGTTGTPKGVTLCHENTVAGIDGFHEIVPDIEYRIVSLLPLSHLFEQAIGLYLLLDLGADILYARSMNPRILFEAFRAQRLTAMIVVPQVLELFSASLEREVERRGRTALFRRLRTIARPLPMWTRRLIFRSTVHATFGGHLRLFVSAGAYLPPAVQQTWEDFGIVVMQGYGATETGSGAATTWHDHPPGTVGWPMPGVEMRLAEDGEVQFRGPSVTRGYWQDEAATAAAFTEDGFYRTGDLGHLDAKGRLVLHGRKKDMIVLPNGFNVFPEDIENALRVAGIRDSVVLETEPGRIEAIVLAPTETQRMPAGGAASRVVGAFGEGTDLDRLRVEVDTSVRAANASLAAHSRIAAWRFWPDVDFPRTLTLKVKRNEVRAWATVAAPLPVTEAS
ncbi:MAG TPA: AMP-binding protein [Candidatus Nanopelagicales bacterium]|nr:AMP-binding protein [Candidatus Nanopelagicales bacterium]